VFGKLNRHDTRIADSQPGNFTIIGAPLDFESSWQVGSNRHPPATLPENQGREPLTVIGALELPDNFGE